MGRLISSEEFKAAFLESSWDLSAEDADLLCHAYASNEKIRWQDAIKDLCNLDIAIGSDTSPSRTAARCDDVTRNEIVTALTKPDVSEQVQRLLDLLGLFFSERRVLVSDSFADFESKDCLLCALSIYNVAAFCRTRQILQASSKGNANSI